MEPIQLTEQEAALIKPFFDACDARREGFAQGIETAKTLLLTQIIKSRPQATPVTPESVKENIHGYSNNSSAT